MNIIDRSLCGLPLPQREHLIRQDERARRAGLPCHGKTSERGEQGYLVTARRASAASRATLSRQDERARRAGLPCHGKTSERGEQGYISYAVRSSSGFCRASGMWRSCSQPDALDLVDNKLTIPEKIATFPEACPARLPL